MKKRIFSMLLVLTMVLSLFGSMTIYAASSGKLTVNAGDIKDGKVEVKVELSENPGIAGMVFSLVFDKTKLTVNSYTKGTVLGGSPLSNLDQGGDMTSYGEATFQWSNPSDVTSNGTLLTVVFDVHSGDWEETELNITYNPGDIANQTFDDVNPAVVKDSVGLPEFDFTFNGATKTYNGSVQKLEAKGLNGATVTYENNDNKNAGTYEVKAIARKAGYRTKTKVATLKIEQKELTITGLTAENKVYNNTKDAVLTGGTLNGVVTGDDVSVVMPTVGEFASANAGNGVAVSFDAIALNGAAKDNYKLTQPTGIKANITKAPVTVTADNKQKREGAVDPELTYQYTGTLYGDEFTGNLERVAGEAIGTYEIKQGTLTLGSNYAITYVKGEFKIVDKTPQNIVLADIADKTYGDADFNLEVTADEVSGLSAFTYDSSDKNVATVDATGKVTIVGAGETIISVTEAGNADYAETTVTKKLTVNKAGLVIKVDDVEVTYGDEITTNITYTGFVKEEDKTVLTKDVAVSGYSSKPNAGEYEIVLGGAEAANYNITYENATLTVNKKDVTVTEFKVFDKAADTTTTATINASTLVLGGLIAGDDVTVDLTTAVAEFASTEVGENVVVNITNIELIGDDAANYNLTNATFTTTANIKETLMASDIAAQIIALTVVKDAENVVVPNVPTGYTVTLKASDNEEIVKADGTIVPVENDTTVGLTFTVTNDADETDTADTIVINVTIPAASKVTVTATAEANGTVTGSGEYLKNSEVTVVATANSGYNFTGWYVGETSVSTNATYTFKADSDVELVAKFERRRSSGGGGGGVSSYTVKFESNGGSAVTKQSVKRNGVAKEPTAPTKEGFEFKGWYTDKELKTAYDFTAKVTKSVTLYAKWVEIDVTKTQIILTIGKKDALVFGETKANDVAPKIVNDRTMLPARFVAESLGAKVTWTEAEPSKVLITKGNVEIIIYIGSDKAYVNGKEVMLDSPAFIENDRTYTPIRFISEELGATVEWNQEVQTVTITKK